MFRFVCRLTTIALAAAALGAAFVLSQSGDWVYQVQEWLHRAAYRRFDGTIREVAKKHGVDPMLVKAVIWRESGFETRKLGRNGERGLMQVTEAAASDWARGEKIESFAPGDLLDPTTNIQAGTWYLAQALNRWRERDDPKPFALAEYNAGKRRVDKWIQDSNMGAKATADDLRSAIAFPTTRQYLEDILERYRFYQRRGWM